MDQLFLLLILCMSSLADDDPSTWKPCGVCRCRFSDKEYEADCSSRLFQDIPSHIPRNITILDISHNIIKELSPTRLKAFSFLKILDLSHNSIKSLHVDTFVGAETLVSLNLHKNLLLMDNNSYPEGLFRDLKHIQKLDLSENDESVMTKAKKYPDATFGDLTSLEELFLDGGENVTFGPGFANLVNLTHLSLSGENGYCAIYNLLNDSFENASSVSKLDLRKCKITAIDANVFLPLKNSITDLDLSDNIYLGFESFGKSLHGLQFSSLKILRINRIVMTFAVGVSLKEKDLSSLRNLTNLKELYADGNRIETMDDTVPQLLTRLENVSITECRLTFGPYLFSLDRMESLKNLYIMDQYISEKLPLAQRSSLSKRPEGTPSSLRWRKRKKKVREEGNTHFSRIIHHLKYQIPLPPNVTFINASNIYVGHKIEELFLLRNNIKHVDLSKNQLHKWIGPIHEVQNLEIVDLSNNYCTEINASFMVYATNLKILNVSKNFLAASLENDVHGTIFFNQINLEELGIGFNVIRRLPKQLFNRQAKLKKLDLSWNMMEKWEVKVSHMRQLNYIDLAKNRFESVPVELRQQIDIIMKGRKDKFIINLNYNNLKCGCDDLDYLDWLTKDYIIFEDKFNTSCKMSDGSTTAMDNLEELVLILKKKCKVTMPLLLGSLSGLVLFLGLVVSGLVYRYRWKLRYMYYTSRRKYRGYQRVGQQEDQYTYDAFVSFADEDRDFVVDDMRRILEDQHGLKLCIHQRDFMVGEPITANIINAIQTSRKTIVVLSPNFIASSWCEYEVRMARLENIHTERDILCVLWYADIPNPREISVDLLEEIVTGTYIKYPEGEADRALFWTTLKDSLLQ